jgi:ketosteroid isomerase-like protein
LTAAAPDTAALIGLVGAYASAVDGRDLDTLRGLFLADATVTVRRGGAEPQVFGGQEGLAGVIEALTPFAATLHEVSSPVFQLGPDADEATGECAVVAHHVRAGDDLVLHGRYSDRFRRAGDGAWRFAARELNVLWTEKRPVRLT